MSTVQSQLRPAFQNALTRPADVTQTMQDIFNLAGYVDGTFPNTSLSETALTAHAGGTQAAALPLSPTVFTHVVNTVATSADSVRLPVSVAGQFHLVVNNAATNSMQVYGAGTDTINNIATATGVAQAAGLGAVYYCPVAGTWYRLLGS